MRRLLSLSSVAASWSGFTLPSAKGAGVPVLAVAFFVACAVTVACADFSDAHIGPSTPCPENMEHGAGGGCYPLTGRPHEARDAGADR